MAYVVILEPNRDSECEISIRTDLREAGDGLGSGLWIALRSIEPIPQTPPGTRVIQLLFEWHRYGPFPDRETISHGYQAVDLYGVPLLHTEDANGFGQTYDVLLLVIRGIARHIRP